MLSDGDLWENEIRRFLKKAGFEDVIEPHTEKKLNKVKFGSQEIDAFGRYRGVCVVVDAKTKVSLASKGRDVHKHLSVIEGYKDEVTKYLEKKYKSDFKEVVFVFWTNGLKIEDEEKKRAKKLLKIALRDENHLRNYRHALNALKDGELLVNGFFKDLLMQLPNIKVFETHQPTVVNSVLVKKDNVNLFTFPIQVKDLLRYAFIFRLEMNDTIGESYQRLLRRKKIQSAQEYLLNERGYFPNNLIATCEDKIDFDNPKAKKDPGVRVASGKINLPNRPCYIEILDGQHRLYAYANQKKLCEDYVLLTLIEPIDSRDRARLFLRINKSQTHVESDLIWDLYQYSEPKTLNERISRFVYKLNEAPPLSDLIATPRVKASTAYLSFSNFCTTIGNQTDLLRQYETLKPGDKTAKHLLEVTRQFFSAICNDPVLTVDWHRTCKTTQKCGFLRTNNGIAVLLRLLQRVIDKSDGFPIGKRILDWKMKLKEWVLDPLKAQLDDYVKKNPPKNALDPYADLRLKLTNEGARTREAEEIWDRSPMSKVSGKVPY